jgi:hypothetical protein
VILTRFDTPSLLQSRDRPIPLGKQQGLSRASLERHLRANEIDIAFEEAETDWGLALEESRTGGSYFTIRDPSKRPSLYLLMR